MTDETPAGLLGRAEAAYRLSVADPVAAAPVAAAVVEQARRDEHHEALVVGLRAQAWSARELLAAATAKIQLDEAVRIARRRGLGARLGELLVSRAAVNHELGRFVAARRDLEGARPLLSPLVVPEHEVQFAALQQNAGQLHAAAARYRGVLADAAVTGEIRVKALNNLGLIEAELGQYAVASRLLEQAERLAPDAGPALHAYVAEGCAWVMARSGHLPRSLELFERAERLYEAAGLPAAELHSEQADAMSDLRLIPEATAAAGRAVAEFTASGTPLMVADARLRLARLALLADDAVAAAEAAGVAEGEFRRQRRPQGTASAAVLGIEARARAGTATAADLRRARQAAAQLDRLNLGIGAIEAHTTAARVAQALGRRDWAAAGYERAYELARGGAVLTRLQGRVAAASAANLRGEDRRLLQHCRGGLDDLDRHRAVLASTELRVLASAHGAELGQLGLRAVVRSRTPAEVFGWLERTRAAALLAVQRTVVPGVEEELALLRSLQTELDATGGASPELVSRHAALEHRLRRVTWSRTPAVATVATPVSAGEVRPLLGDRRLVEYGTLGGDVIAVVVAAAGTRLVRLGALADVQGEVEGLLLALRLLSRRASSSSAPAMRLVAEQRLRRLRDLLVEPLRVPVDAELVVVPAGPLQRVPWSALHAGPVAVAPSASFWSRALLRPPPGGRDTVIVGGPQLAGVTAELQHLGGLHPRAVVLPPPGSTVDAVAAALKTAALAHFACHGRIRSDNPMFSGLLLSDGSLTVQELELRDVAPHRLVLAACESAADVVYPGGETLGFVSALLAQGTAGLVASMILVPDSAAVPLMAALHRNLGRGETLPVALHHARAAADRDDAHEFVNWCGFTAYGAA